MYCSEGHLRRDLDRHNERCLDYTKFQVISLTTENKQLNEKVATLEETLKATKTEECGYSNVRSIHYGLIIANLMN